jgi:hypothetical protein
MIFWQGIPDNMTAMDVTVSALPRDGDNNAEHFTTQDTDGSNDRVFVVMKLIRGAWSVVVFRIYVTNSIRIDSYLYVLIPF